MPEILDVGFKLFPIFTFLQVRFINTITHCRWTIRKMVKIKKRAGTEIWLWYGWIAFSCFPISTQESIFVPHSLFHLVNISQICAAPPCSSLPFKHCLSSRFHATPFFFLEFIFIPCLIPLYCHSIFFPPPAVGQCIFKLVSQTSLKARSSKEKFDISFRPIVSHLQRTALWLVDSQLIKPLVVWHPVPSSGGVTLLNEIN